MDFAQCKGGACVHVLSGTLVLNQLCPVTQAGRFPWDVNPLQIAQAPLRTHYLYAQSVIQLHRDILEFELASCLAQEQKEMAWTE